MFERGSEWRRWDLHLHTPNTKKNDLYLGRSSEEKWDRFYEAIDNYVGDESDNRKVVSVIGITDVVDEKEVKYQINPDAFRNIQAYKGIAEGL